MGCEGTIQVHVVSRQLGLATLIAAGIILMPGCGGEESAPSAASTSTLEPGGSPAADGPAATSALRSAIGDPSMEFPLDAARLDALDVHVRSLVDEFAAAIEASPEDPAPRRRLAMVFQANGLEADAVDAWRQALSLEPVHVGGWYNLARSRYALGEIDAAIEDMTRAIRIDGDQPHPMARRAQWRLELGEDEAARADLDAVLERFPQYRPARLMLARLLVSGTPVERGQALREILVPLRDAGGVTPYARFLTGDALRRMGRTEEAEPELLMGAGSTVAWGGFDPEDAELRRHWVGERAEVNRGSALIAAGRADEAIRRLQPFLGDPAEDAAVRVMLATAMMENRQLDQASALLLDGLRARPDELPLILTLAELRRAEGDFTTATSLVEQVLQRDDASAAGHELLARLRFDRGDWTGALESARRAVELEPSRFDANLLVGLALESDPQTRPAAFRQLQATRRLHPDRWETYFYLAAFLATIDRMNDARTFAKRAIELAPEVRQVRELATRIGGIPIPPRPGASPPAEATR